MGRIKSTLVKRATKEMLNLSRNTFSGDFEQNKKRVNEMVPGISKKLRNSIAGYISRLMTKKQ